MELSRPLSLTARHILRTPDLVEVFVHLPRPSSRDQYIVVCDWFRSGKEHLKATGASASRFEAYVKALVELGEVVLCARGDFPDRSGLAGGLFARDALIRAKGELLERDAFLFHYRSGVPFVSRREVPGQPDCCLFEMSSADRHFTCFFAAERTYVDGGGECLKMGLGAHPDPEIAVSKAAAELACMVLDHEMRPDWCRSIYEGKTVSELLVDVHHASSRDPRNAAKMRALFRAGRARAEGSRRTPEGDWRVEAVESPLRYFSYVRATHEGLSPLEFGRPEIPARGGERPLYHPVW